MYAIKGVQHFTNIEVLEGMLITHEGFRYGWLGFGDCSDLFLQPDATKLRHRRSKL